MDVHCLLQLPATAFRWRFSSGAWRLTVVTKATFDLLPMKAARSGHQEPVHPADQHHNDNPGNSLRIGSDLTPYKPRTDIVVVGSAYAPHGRPTRQLTARVVLGECEKVVEVVADRSIGVDGAIHEGPAFKSMPLTYERAAGGHDSWNPVGISQRSRDASGRLRLPNLLPPGASVDTVDVQPIGFGPIAPGWSTRTEWLGAHATRWKHGVYGEDLVVPDDLDLRYFNIAPLDQQLSTPVAPGAHLLFDCLTASGSRLSTYLPDLSPYAVATLGSRQEKLPMTADTFVVDSDRATCTITYRAVFPLQGPHEQVSVAIIDGNGAHAPSMRGSQIEDEHSKSPDLQTMTGSAAVDGPTMPFSKRSLNKVVIRPPGDSALPFSQSGAQQAAPAPPPPAPPPPPSSPGMPKPLMQLGNMGAAPSFQTVEVPLSMSVPQVQRPVPPAPPPPPSVPSPLSALGPPPPAFAPPPPAPAPPPPVTAPPIVPSPQPAPIAPAPVSNTGPPAVVVPNAGVSMAQLSSAPSSGGQTTGQRSMMLQGATEAQRPSYLKSAAEAAGQAKPQIVPVGHAASAAKVGVVAASDAAAALKTEPPPAKTEARAPQPVNDTGVADAREILEIIWYDNQAVPKAKRSRMFRDLFSEKKVRRGLLAAPEETSDEGKERIELSQILGHPRPLGDVGAVDISLAGSVDEHGMLEPPHVVLTGDLVLLLDDRVLLEAMANIVTPFLATDKTLAEAHELAEKALDGKWTIPKSIEQALKRLRDATAKYNQAQIESSARRQCLERKSLEQRGVLGGDHIRASLAFSETQSVVVYIPMAAKERLPLFERFPIRALATVHPKQDPLEQSPSAVLIAALARRHPRPGMR